MASDIDYEDGEILEEGEEVEQNPRKRLHSSLQDARPTESASIYDNRPPLSHRQPTRYNNSSGNGYSDRRRDAAPHDHQDDRAYAEDLIVKYPRQQPCSNVLLDFATWMGAARSRKRLDVEDVQKLVLNVLRGGSRKKEGMVSPYLLPYLTPGARLPSKVCIVLLEKLHPSVLQKFRAKLSFFDECSSVPVMLTKQEGSQIRRSEAPLSELMYKFPRPTVDTHELSTDELFYAHELTFLMKHSAGFTDELVFTPAGKFTRKNQPLGGTWEIDGDLLHLKWRQRTVKAPAAVDETPTDQDTAMEEEEDDAYTLDVLVSQDGSMHELRTDPVTDETYAHKVPEHLAKKRRGDDKPRSIWLSLAKAIAVDDEPLKREAFEYYVLTPEELKQHGFPTDVEEEQRKLLEATQGNTRDRYVATQPRSAIIVEESASVSDDEEGAAMETDETIASASSSGEFIYALDCEMCETDIGMELTRVTAVDITGNVVYDQLVKPQSTIINYHTKFSGISEETLRDTKYTLADVQRDLTTRLLFKDTILVGHSLTSDLRALRLVHSTIGDTAILYPHQRGFPFRTSLKYLTKTYLKKDIQIQTQAGHDSAEDAIAALELLVLKVRRGPWFGIPESVSTGGAFDSILDKSFAFEKKMTMLRLQSNGELTEDGAPKTTVAERKPWELYASGDLKAQSQSAFRHAQAPDLCWVEIEPPSASAALCNDFVGKHDLWMAEQQAYCEQVDGFLKQLRDEVLPKGTLLLALPQGDLSLLRYLKGLRTRSKWRDATPSGDDIAPEELHAAVGDAFRGAMDSCLFLTQK
ncbi:exonuclease, putative [Phytophthora infestans T30-4]|uniref:Exonuclease, putative n=1 Tax=Phytophthora infestans (strain T30-4) TaxID=403677 RepID=D0NAM7_PHYIT|nr:exonuclease, putative [Phytophthora infestans T30-4]EEY54885.1 exonuclease, putative [Phytophthora infestans T30-4]|eukprot:XP_002903830.1 exonuclease, putative [Phytophthora infestans T30-4]